MYRAQEVAKYVIGECTKAGKPVDNMKLQKMLYFLWIEYYRQTGKNLFNDEIQAWKYGPVIPAVYWRYRTFIADPICLTEPNTVSQNDASILSPLVMRYNKRDVRSLVGETHAKGPWKTIYDDGKGMSGTIPYDMIRDYADSYERRLSRMERNRQNRLKSLLDELINAGVESDENGLDDVKDGFKHCTLKNPRA